MENISPSCTSSTAASEAAASNRNDVREKWSSMRADLIAVELAAAEDDCDVRPSLKKSCLLSRPLAVA